VPAPTTQANLNQVLDIGTGSQPPEEPLSTTKDLASSLYLGNHLLNLTFGTWSSSTYTQLICALPRQSVACAISPGDTFTNVPGKGLVGSNLMRSNTQIGFRNSAPKGLGASAKLISRPTWTQISF
jgi:hypothetical protein